MIIKIDEYYYCLLNFKIMKNEKLRKNVCINTENESPDLRWIFIILYFPYQLNFMNFYEFQCKDNGNDETNYNKTTPLSKEII
jgi:hypothetical protein